MLNTLWFNTVLAKGLWTYGKHLPSVGVMKACEVIHSETGELAFMKPGKPISGQWWKLWKQPRGITSRLANERIASHLAYLLNMNIPPVLLGFNPEKSRYPVCYSQIPAMTFVDWNNIRSDTPQGVQERAMNCLHGYLPVVALTVWLEDGDRKNAHTLYFEDEQKHSLGIFEIDYADSMSYGENWEKRQLFPHFFSSSPVSGPKCYIPPPLYRNDLLLESDKRSILDGVRRIERLEWKQVEQHVIGPIPKTFLSTKEKNFILESLQKRRDNLEAIVKNSLTEIEKRLDSHKMFLKKHYGFTNGASAHCKF